MKSMFDLQEKGENFMFIANFHAMTTLRDGAALREAIAIFETKDGNRNPKSGRHELMP